MTRSNAREIAVHLAFALGFSDRTADELLEVSLTRENFEQLKEEDRDFVLDVLNYDMAGIFASLGIDTAGGRFEYVEEKKVDKTEQIAVVEKLHGMGLPLSDDYLYSTFDIEKPEDYDARKAEAERRRTEAIKRLSNTVQREDEEPSDRTLVNRVRGFFGMAPRGGAHRPLDF